MANGYAPRNILLNTEGASLGASETDTVITKDTPIYASGSIRLRIDLSVSGVTVGGGITVQLQQFTAGVWSDLTTTNSTASITGNGVFSIKLLVERAADQADMPLGQKVRLVGTTGAGSAVTFDIIQILQGL